MKKSILMSMIALFAIASGVQAFAQEDKVQAPTEQETQEEGAAVDQGSEQTELRTSAEKQ